MTIGHIELQLRCGTPTPNWKRGSKKKNEERRKGLKVARKLKRMLDGIHTIVARPTWSKVIIDYST